MRPEAQPEGPGPYEAWVYGPGRDYDLPQLLLDDARVLSAVAEVTPPIAPPVPRGATRPDPGGPAFLVPTLYRQEGLALSFVPYLIAPAGAEGAEGFVAAAAGLRRLMPGGGRAVRHRLNFPLRDASVDIAFPGETALAGAAGGPPPKVVVALIDEGIPFAHRAFRRPGGGSRVACCWSQAAPASHEGAVLFGREFTGAAIAALVARHGRDEAAIYREAGLARAPGGVPMPLDGMTAHGAHVADLLTGGADEDVAVIAVDLPATVSWDTSGFGKDMFVLSALHYVFERAGRLAEAHGIPPLPVVVNLSYGHSGGPHDGSALMAAAFDELVAARRRIAPTAVVMPSGNTYLGRLHARLEAGHFTGGRAEAKWFLPPDDRTSTYLEVWFGEGLDPGAAGAEVSLTPPDGAPVVLTASGGPVLLRAGGGVFGRLSFERYRGGRWRAVATLAPTAPRRPGLTAAKAGVWRVGVKLAAPGPVDLWVQRDVSAGQGRTGARQSWLVDPLAPQYGADGAVADCDPEAAAMLRRSGTLNGMAFGATTLVAAGYSERTRSAAFYSSAGDLHGGKAVDVSAVTERSPWAPGVVAGGTRSGVYWSARGTSTAAPQVARALAEAFRTAPPAPGPAPDNYAGLLAGGVPGPGTGPESAHRLGQVMLARA